MTEKDQVLSKDEKAALRALAAERRKKFTPEEHAAEVAEKIASMRPEDRAIGEAVHRIAMKVDPTLEPKTWYGMPAWTKDGKTILFFQDAGKFKVRYCTVGFQPDANLDDGDMWATSFAVLKVTPDVESMLIKLITKATSS